MLAEVSGHSDASSADKGLWGYYLDKAAAVSVDATRQMFQDAAGEFHVPQVLLEAIGYLENNWIQIGPSIDRGWGVMHLVDNDYSRTLNEAAELLKVDPQVLKDDPRQNIRGAAALLAVYAAKTAVVPARQYPAGKPLADGLAGTGKIPDPQITLAVVPGAVPETSLEDWFPAASEFSGLRTRELRDQQARAYFAVIDKGIVEKNVFNQMVRIQPQRIDFGRIGSVSAGDAPALSPEYPYALDAITPNNHYEGRGGQKIDTFVEHWMGAGTYAGAISWFHNPNSRVSAHFCIRHDDGEITQVISVNDTAWHAGGHSCPWTNNARSIGVEHEATVTHPEWWNSEPMLDASARLTRFFCDKYGIPATHPAGLEVTGGIIGHQQVPGCTPNSGCHSECPGNLPWDILMQKISAIQ
jgi:N-acetyl-anhydromuramyl-L-alanine amidase AmpD